MITLEDDQLVFRFPEIHRDAVCRIDFQRTLRIPDDGRDYPLPAGLGAFPLRHLDDFADRLPTSMVRRGGVVMPMYQAEAMWLSFDEEDSWPCAIKVATGKVNAISGEPWSAHLNRDPQDYLVVPEQPWLDGYSVGEGLIRQFVAMPLGKGYTVEEQLTGAAEIGGLQLMVYPMKAEAYERVHRLLSPSENCEFVHFAECIRTALSMGLAPGGRMKQEVYDDPHSLDVWDQRAGRRCFVTLVDALSWRELTGEMPPTKPPGARAYAAAGLPWFDYYAADLRALKGSRRLARTKSIRAMQTSKGENVVRDDGPARVGRIVQLDARRSPIVREADF